LHKEIPDLKLELGAMNDEISLKNEELRYLRNDSIQLDKEILETKEEIKRVNKCNTDIKREKESLKTGIALLKRHIISLKEKISKQEATNRSFLYDVSILVNESFSSTTNSSRK
jgi:chromosome segregation ATPase